MLNQAENVDYIHCLLLNVESKAASGVESEEHSTSCASQLPSSPSSLSPTTSQCCRLVNVVQRYTPCRTVRSHPVTC